MRRGRGRAVATQVLALLAAVSPCLAAAVVPLPDPPYFGHLTTADGLPEDTVRDILQDRVGFLWVGTQNGLARYDGSEIRVFRPVAGDSTSIGGRAIFALHEDAFGCIWVGTAAGGLSCFDPRTGVFSNYAPSSPGARALPGRFVLGIASAPDSTLWIAMQDGGLAWRDRRSGAFQRVALHEAESASARRDSLTALLAARDGAIFVGMAGGGIGRYDPVTRQWNLYLPSADNPTGPRTGLINHIVQDHAGRIWFATVQGLALWVPESARLQWYRPQPTGGGEWENYLTRIAEDPSGRLWLASAVGLYMFEPAAGVFRLFRNDLGNRGTIAPGPVMSVACDRTGAIWTGGWQSGLSCLDPWRTRFTVLTHNAADSGSLDQDAVVSVLEGRDGTLWVGTGGVTGVHEIGRLNRRAPGSARFERVDLDGLAEIRTVLALCEDGSSGLWIGTDRGLLWLPRGASSARPVVLRGFDAAALGGAGIYALALDPNGVLWAGSFGRGLFRIERARGAATQYVHDPADPHSLSQNRITRLHCDPAGRIWVGTSNAGLNVLDPGSGRFDRLVEPRSGLGTITDFVDADAGGVYVATEAGLFLVHPDRLESPSLDHLCGLPDVAVMSVVRDAEGGLWIHTARGLFHCGADAAAAEPRFYGAYYGVPSGEMYFGSCGGGSGRMYFGSKQGLLVVDPRDIRVNPYVPPVVITGLQVNDEPAGPATAGAAGRVFPFVERVVLPFDRNDLRFNFAALQLAQAERVRFRYRLQHDDRAWKNAGAGAPVANYTNLAPGSYVFEVQLATSADTWSPNGASLQVEITPPWWSTSWARSVYALLAVGFVALVYRSIVQRERIRTALEVERAEARHLQELDHVKSRFFANISHEFRTPLTLILGPLARLRQASSGESLPALDMIGRNARRLGELIEQLLDLSRLEAGRLTVRWERREILAWLRALVSSFDSLATDRGIGLTTEIPARPEVPARAETPSRAIEVWFDPDLLQKIVVNLLSNAFKFTPAGGVVRVTVDVGHEATVRVPGAASEHLAGRSVRIVVTNSGSFIPEADRERIFERFHQLPDGMAAGGTGIGLALTRELVDLLGGSITVESSQEEGTSFHVTVPTYTTPPVPMDADVQTPQRPPAVDAANVIAARADESLLETADAPAPESPEEQSARPRLLVVEDNAELRAFLASELGDVYEVLQAADGNAGLATAIEELPELVLSDVIMPGIDGIELCRRLKTDARTDHIAVVLLSARAEVESRLAGLGSGADDYQAKPFDARELRLRIRNLIEERRRLRERYARQVVQLGSAALPVTSAQERFLKRACEIIDAHIDDGDFSVEQLAGEIGMSKAQLLRKVRAVTGEAPRDLIRTRRLQRAAHLLQSGYGNVTEVALAVGMESLSTFAKRFREQYGVAPSEFANRQAGRAPEAGDLSPKEPASPT